jgi:hypothetical protein
MPDKKQNGSAIDRIMGEHIGLPGVAGIIVTRAFAWQFMLDCGDNPKMRGQCSMDFAVFFPPPLDEPLTVITPELSDWLQSVSNTYRAQQRGLPL